LEDGCCPAFAKSDLHIEAKENAVRIAGKKEVKYQEDASVHRREGIRGVFDRTIAIPIQIDPTAFAPSTAMACRPGECGISEKHILPNATIFRRQCSPSSYRTAYALASRSPTRFGLRLI
jgi:hypothetical protein